MLRNVNCRNSFYSRSTVRRFPVPDELIPWSVEYLEYKPIFYESDVLLEKPWADPKIGKVKKICVLSNLFIFKTPHW